MSSGAALACARTPGFRAAPSCDREGFGEAVQPDVEGPYEAGAVLDATGGISERSGREAVGFVERWTVPAHSRPCSRYTVTPSSRARTQARTRRAALGRSSSPARSAPTNLNSRSSSA